MWKFLQGAQPPAKKAKGSYKKDYMKAYEESRSRTFDEGWRVGKEGRKREWTSLRPRNKANEMHRLRGEEEDEEEEVESEVEESEKVDEPTTSATPDEFFW